MRTVGSFEAKTHLSQLLSSVEGGEEVVITRRGQAVARLVPMDGARDRGAAVAKLEALRATLRGRVTSDEILEARETGRR